ncbi:hypothetical protein PFNF135_06174, partial [Plasmodium falciparum NF135/5.C10]
DTTGSSGEPTGGKDGATCIPPRRRRLYVGKLQEWAKNYNTDKSQAGEASQGNGVSTETPESSLLHAFVKSAAVETFFLWHRYKKKWALQKAAEKAREGGLPGVGVENGEDEDKDPQKKLQESGEIPDDFLRQMFYTLGDYRDILYSGSNDTSDSKSTSNSNDNLKNIVLEASNDKENMQKIQDKIKEHINSGSKAAGIAPKSSAQTPKDWWENNAKHIWNGMIYALTYKDSEQKGGDGKPTEDPTVRAQLWDDTKKQPKKDNYTYEKVVLKDENSGTGPKTTGDTQPPTLKQFTSRPPYFRYLEEWGETFCRERKKRLKQIKKDCNVEENDNRRGGGTKKQYSGDGEDCTQQVPKKDGTVPDLEGSSCAISCRSYKKWIKKKRTEFEEQKGIYKEQKENCEKESEGAKNKSDRISDKDFLQKLGSDYTSIESFLEKLKNGPCKNNNGENEKKEDGYIDFNKEDKTFGHENYCDPCSKFKIKCENCNSSGDNTQGKCNGKTPIDAKDIENMGTSTEDIVMLVNDKSGNGFQNGLKDCAGADIFEGIKKEQWKCVNICGLDVCGLKKDNNNIDDKQIILIRALFKRWLENFLEDYKKIRKKLKPCMNSVEQSPCIRDCQDKCDCVGQWVEKKRVEWQQIKERFNDQYKSENSGDTFPVRSFLETLIPQITDVNEKEKVIKISKFDNPCGCSASANVQKDNNQDAIECMINRLQQKAEKCQQDHKPSDENTAQCQEYTPPVGDDDDPLEEEENENPVGKHPSFCNIEKKAETVDEDACKAPTEENSGDDNPEQTPPLKPEKEAPEQDASEPKQEKPAKGKKEEPQRRPIQPPYADHPAVIPSLVNGSIYMWMWIDTPPPTSGNTIPTSDIPNTPSDTPSPITDEEWNTLKDEFISNMLQSQPNTEPNILHDNVDNNTHPTPSHNKLDQKPFITSIHDRNLYTGEEYNYNVNMVNSMNDIPINSHNNVYSGIDLINDSLNSNNVDIYDELLKRKENELFGTNHTKKNTSTNSVAKNTNSDSVMNQLDLFHTWLDRHRDMCEKWKNNHERLAKLKEEWENETHSGDINSGIPSGNHVLNTDVSIQIDMDNPKPKNEFTNMDTNPDKSTMDTILDDLEKYNEPYYYYFYKDDIYYDVNDDDKTSMDNNNNLVNKNNPVDSNSSTYNHHNPADINKTFVDINNHNQHPIEKPTKIQIEMNSNNRECYKLYYIFNTYIYIT